MNPTEAQLTPRATLAQLAAHHPAASRIFRLHRLDFCRGGARRLDEACADRGLDPDAILDAIRRESEGSPLLEKWADRPLTELISHIVATYHAPLRPAVQELIDMAVRVEASHRGEPSCPRGLAEHLRLLADDVDAHLATEEAISFPMIAAGQGRAAYGPVAVMTREHDDHRANLQKIRQLTDDLTPPEGACRTWHALYIGLEALEKDLMEHIHLENDILFPRALEG